MRWPFFSDSVPADLPHAVNRLLSRRRRLQRKSWLGRFSFLALFCSALVARATSVVPPSFPELVAEAQVIAQGTVTAVESRWVDAPRGRVIKTFVTVAVEKQLKGEPRDTITLEFLGGTVGSDTLRVSGMPEFRLGAQEIVFVQGNGVQFCPLVRFGHGRYHVRTDAQTHRHYVTRNDESPLSAVADVQQPTDDHGARTFRSSGDALTSDEFETQISQEVARAAAQR